jgi:hypothetical protein
VSLVTLHFVFLVPPIPVARKKRRKKKKVKEKRAKSLKPQVLPLKDLNF